MKKVLYLKARFEGEASALLSSMLTGMYFSPIAESKKFESAWKNATPGSTVGSMSD